MGSNAFSAASRSASTTGRTLTSLLEKDLTEPSDPGWAWERFLANRLEQVKKALEIIAQVADDRESRWQPASDLVDDYFEAVKLDLLRVDERPGRRRPGHLSDVGPARAIAHARTRHKKLSST